MKLSLKWLQDYISFDLSVEELCHKLTMAGLEVEKVEKVKEDTVIEMEITPNRPDCLNVLGLAREVGAILNKKTKALSFKAPALPKKRTDITIEDKAGCWCYLGTIVEDVTIKKADDFIIDRIYSLGLRPINNVVDITNFCLMEMGQPLHAFDFDKLVGGKIIVRRAKKGEKIVTIDDVHRELDPSILVIADAEKPVAIAGIMGGKETEVTQSTKNILLESAYFDPILIRRASRKLALASDSSYRFERGVDYDTVSKGSQRARGMILERAQGRITHYAKVEVAKREKTKQKIAISVKEMEESIGAFLTISKCKNILEKLGFEVEGKKILKVVPPSFRSDVKRKADIVEEVARIIGYDNLPMSIPHITMSSIPVDMKRKRRAKIRDILCAQGLNEVITFTMTSQELLKKTKQETLKTVTVQNPLNQDQEIMRASLLPSLLTVAASNIKRGQKDLFLFETGKVYSPKEERETLAVLYTGVKCSQWREEKKRTIDFYDIKGVIELVLEAFVIDPQQISFVVSSENYFEQGQRTSICLKNKIIGEMGKVEDEVLHNFGIKREDVFFAQMDLETLYGLKEKEQKFIPIPEFPSVKRDISLAVKKNITAQAILECFWRYVPQNDIVLSSVSFVEKYEGDKIPDDQRGLVFSLEYQSSTRTLTDQDVEAVHKKICQELVRSLGVIKR